MSLLCETVTATRLADLRAARAAVRFADLVELRLDGVADLDVAGALEGRTRPVIVTCRPTWEGGRFDGSEEERLGILREAIRLGAEFVDVEWRADRRTLPPGERTTLVVSRHDFEGVPADLEDLIDAMWRANAGVVKVAVTPHRLADCLRLREAARGDGRHVLVGMGAAGWLTRVFPALFGSAWTYAGRAAPGQLSAEDMAHTYRVNRTSPATALYGVAGQPLAHSASPAMHNAALVDVGLDAVYVPFETADADDLLHVAGALGVQGMSVTAPLKEALFARVQTDDELARHVGAVNTLRWRQGSVQGQNFDVAGFLSPLERRRVALWQKRAVVLGSGGAARAAAWALSAHGARVEIAARRQDAAERLARDLRVQVGAWPPAPGWDLLVNATPVGTWPRTEEAPVPREAVKGALVYDLVYHPLQTQLLDWAHAAGAVTIGGLEMLVSQARRQFEWWTGRDASLAVMERAAEAFIGRAEGP